MRKYHPHNVLAGKQAVAFANFGKLRFKSEYEQNIWNEAVRLITNCILYYNLTLLSKLPKEKALCF